MIWRVGLKQRKIPDSVCWQEGMRLVPQHFQFQAARTERLVSYLASLAHPYYWGCLSLSFELGGSVLRLTACEAVMPDGTPVVFLSGNGDRADVQAELKIDLAKHVDNNGQYLISLACKLPVAENISDCVDAVAVVDALSGRSTNIATWRPQLELVCGLPPGYSREDLLPLVRCSSSLGVFRIDETFFASTPRVSSQTALVQYVSGICSLLRTKYREFSDRFIARKAVRVDLDAAPMEAERIMQNQWMLAILGQHLMEMEGMQSDSDTHPHQIYQALLRLAGALTATAAEPDCPIYRRFDYRDLHASLDMVWSDIVVRLDRFLPPFETHFFKKEMDARFTLSLQACPLSERFVIGLEPGKSMSSGDMINWLSKAIIGPATHIEAMEVKRVPGFARQVLGDKEASAYEVYHSVVLFEVGLPNGYVLKETDTLVILDGARDTPSSKLPRSIILFQKRAATGHTAGAKA